MEEEEEPQRPEAATHPSVRPSAVIFWRARAEKRRGSDGGERREETVESSLRLIPTYLPDSTLTDSSRYERPALPVWLQCRYYGQL